jgi:CubicO group peptidase (beta-lactamase class C family)
VVVASVWLVTLVAACGTEGQSTASGRPTGAPVRASAGSISDFVVDYLGESGLRGASVAVVQDGQELVSGGYGTTSGGAAITADTPMYIGSLSKSFTALAVLQLVEEGRIRLDDPIKRHVPDFRTADFRDERITVAHLLRHRSGLSDMVNPEMSRPQPTSLSDAVTALRDVTLGYAPGNDYSYHNPNYQVLARMVEVVRGEPFDDILAERIFAPLDMRQTTTITTTPVRDDERVPGLESGGSYLWGWFMAREESKRFVAGSHGVISTAADLSAWLALLADAQAGREIPPVAAPQMIRLMIASEFGIDRFGGDEIRYAHSGSSFTYSGELTLLPERDLAMVVLTNSRFIADIGFPVTEGLVELTAGVQPTPGKPLPLFVDLVALGLLFGTVAVGTTAFLRAPRWIARRRDRPIGWVLRPLPSVAVVAAIIALPWLLSLLGRDVTWTLLSHLWPMLVVLVVVALVSLLLVWGRRLQCAVRPPTIQAAEEHDT